MTKQYPLLNPIMRIVGVLFVISLILVMKTTYFARQERIRGDTLYQRLEYQQAITHYERAIKWHTPFSRSTRHAIERLWEIGTLAEQNDNQPLAIHAYRSIRASLFAIQSLYMPYENWILKCEEKVANLMATSTSKPHQLGPPDTAEEEKRRFTEMLQRRYTPSRIGVLLTEIGFLGWVASTIGFIWYAFGNDQTWLLRQSVLWGGPVTIFFAVWIIGMLTA